MKLRIFIFTILLVLCAYSNEIVDFQYTEYTRALDKTNQHQGDFNFNPVQIPTSDLQFPEACNLVQRLKESLPGGDIKHFNADIDVYLNSLKEKFQNLLTLTQRLTYSQEKIQHFEQLINKTIATSPNQDALLQLQNIQGKLRNLTLQVATKDLQLRTIYESIKGSQDQPTGQSKRIQLQFGIQVSKQKITYLQKFQQRVREAISQQRTQTNYTQYFIDLVQQFNNQTDLIKNLNEVLNKKQNLAFKRNQLANLKSSIQALEIYIDDIDSCNQEKQKYRIQFKNHQKINLLITQLKLLKLKQVQNSFCQGVVKKLTDRIKTSFRYYDIVMSCASDLQQKVQLLAEQKIQKQKLQAEIKELQKIEDLTQFKNKYNAQKNQIEVIYSKTREWKIKQFIHNPDQIARLKNKQQDQLNYLIRQKQSLTVSSQTSVQRTVPIQVITLVNQIKQIKWQYCDLYRKYEQLNNNIWSQVYRYESQLKLRNKLLALYYEERLNYARMHERLLTLRADIMEKLN